MVNNNVNLGDFSSIEAFHFFIFVDGHSYSWHSFLSANCPIFSWSM